MPHSLPRTKTMRECTHLDECPSLRSETLTLTIDKVTRSIEAALLLDGTAFTDKDSGIEVQVAHPGHRDRYERIYLGHSYADMAIFDPLHGVDMSIEEFGGSLENWAGRAK